MSAWPSTVRLVVIQTRYQLVSFWRIPVAVFFTLGLPLVRTSVAHGTAFDIVGRGRADPAGMLAALDAAERLAGVEGFRAASATSSSPRGW